MEYLAELQNKLNFTCESLTMWKDPNGNSTGFTAFIKDMERCTLNGSMREDDPTCSCDIGVAGWNLNQERLGRVDYLPTFISDTYRVLTHVDNTAASTGDAFFLTAFGVSVWICISSLMVIFTFLKLLDRRFAPPDDSFQPLSKRDYSRFRRYRHFLLKSKILFRLRRAVQSTSTLFNKGLQPTFLSRNRANYVSQI